MFFICRSLRAGRPEAQGVIVRCTSRLASPRRGIPILAYPGDLQARGWFLSTESATMLFTDVVGSTALAHA